MRRPLTALCLGALAASGLAVPAAAVAAPAVAAPAQATAAAVPDELVVGYVAGADATDRGRARGRAGAVRTERVVAAAADRTEVELVRLPAGKGREQAIAELEADPAVAYAEPNWTYTTQARPSAKPGGSTPTAPVDYFANGSLWGMYGDARNAYGSQAAEAWARGNVGSKGVHVGVIDEGIQVDHPDLDANIWTNPGDPVDGIDNDSNGYVDDVHGWDFADGDSSVYDGGTRGSLDDHGTHVAGTIGAVDDSKGVVGVNHRVTMISGKFLGRNGGSLAAAVQAVDYFTAARQERHRRRRHQQQLGRWRLLQGARGRHPPGSGPGHPVHRRRRQQRDGQRHDRVVPVQLRPAERHRRRRHRQQGGAGLLQPVRQDHGRPGCPRRRHLVDDGLQRLVVLQRHLDGHTARHRRRRAVQGQPPGCDGRADQGGAAGFRRGDPLAQRQDRHRRPAGRQRLLDLVCARLINAVLGTS